MNSARKLGGTLGPGVWWRLAAGVAMLIGGLAGTILLVRPDSTPIPNSPVALSSVRLPIEPFAVTAQELQEAILKWAADLPARFPDSADALHASAVLYFELLRPVDAETSWRACLEIAPDHAEASLGLAILATERGEDELAVAILQQTLGMGNRSAEVYHRLGVALNQWGKLAEAGKVLQTGLDRFPQAAEMWLLLGQIQLQLERFDEAEDTLKRALELAPHSADIHFALASAYTGQGDDRAAQIHQQRFQQAKAAGPSVSEDDFDASYLRSLRAIAWRYFGEVATIYQEHGGLDSAEQLLLDAISLYPDRPAHYLELAELYAATGRLADAQQVRRHFADRYPEHLGNQLQLAVLSCELGDLATAEASYRAVLAARPDAASAYAGLAQVYRKARDLKQARRWAEESVRWEPSVAGYQSLAEICHELGDRRSAQAARMEADRLRGKASDGP
ncbi:MAG: tetratricopeptide repeat protein [Planctomycetaceae bacterium]|nr:MAG: tetratricopeptide repeat protein [Planctomycetaceae bacterium]